MFAVLSGCCRSINSLQSLTTAAAVVVVVAAVVAADNEVDLQICLEVTTAQLSK